MSRHFAIALAVFSLTGKAQPASPQEYQVDSLKKIIETAKHDTIIINAWKAWDNLIYLTDPDLDLELNRKIVHLSSGNLKKKLKPGEKLFFKNAEAFGLSNLGIIYNNLGKFSEALDHYFRALAIREEINDKKGTATLLGNIGIIYKDQANYSKALEYYSKALIMAEELGLKQLQANTLSNIGVVYQGQSNYSRALDYYFKSLNIEKELENKSGSAITLGNIGIVYQEQSDYPKALEYFSKALKILEEIGDKRNIAINLGNIGIIYEEQGNPAKALDYYFRALKTFETLGNKTETAIVLTNIGNVYANRANSSETLPAEADSLHRQALDYYFRALKMKEESGDLYGIPFTLGSIGYLYTETGRFREAEKFLLRAAALCDSTSALYVQRDIRKNLSRLYDTTGRYKLALEQYKKYIAIRDSIASEENLKNQTRIEMNYEFEKKQAQLKAEQEKRDALAKAEQDKKDEISRAEKKRQQIVIILVSCVLMVVIVFAIFIFRSLRTTRKQKVIIEGQKIIVEEKHKEITDSINYAERIQRSFLASKELLGKNLNEYFVLFKPRDVVSGDFYFASELKNGNFLLACADSTGHGVPGAIMSILNISSLEKAIEKETEPSYILNETRKLIIERLKKDGSPEGGKDGMDCSLVSFDFSAMKINFALANNPLWIIRENQLIEFFPDKMPVGRHLKESIPFTPQTYILKKNDLVILLTDGYADQFGGPKGKKFKYSGLKKIILETTAGKLQTTNEKLQTVFEEWKSSYEQTDDVCIIGVRI